MLLLPSVALADDTITFFGKFDADAEWVHSSRPGAGAAASRNRIPSNASGIGAKGRKELGGGLQAFWQISSRVNLTGSENGGLFTLWGNSGAGVRGGFGRLFLGVWDTPFRQVYDRIDLFGNTHIASPMAILGSIGNGVAAASTLPTAAQGFPAAVAGVSVASVGFHRRQKSSIQYWTPRYRSLQFRFAYSVDNPGNKSSGANPVLWSFSAAYDRNPLYFAMAYERHQDLKELAGANVKGIDTGIRLVAGCSLGEGRVGLVYERLRFATSAAGATARNAISLSGSYRFGRNSVGAVYTHAGSLSGSSDTGASQYSLRYGYKLGKGFELYGQYTAIRNQANGTYNFGDGLDITTASGATLSGGGVGMVYAF